MLADRLRIVRTIGWRNTLRLTCGRIVQQRAKCFHPWKHLFIGKQGLEIGGPSTLFEKRNRLPVYPLVAGLDNCVFASHTVWMETAQEGRCFRYDAGHRIGYQYICDGTNLTGIPPETYDFVLSCNNLEHIANPIKALREWMRVTTPSGAIVVVVPAKRYNFDHKRPITAFAHLLDDWTQETSEADLSHLDEISALHDITRDRAAGSIAAFRRRCEENIVHRCMHHHVFDLRLLALTLDHVGMQICALDDIRPFHFAAVARKLRPGEVRDNGRFLAEHN